MHPPQLTNAHKLFKNFAGDWQGEDKIYPSSWIPEGSIASTRITNQIALAGFVLIQDLAQSIEDQVVYQAHNLIRWDESEQAYVLHWFDSAGFPPNELRGYFADGALTFVGQDPGGHTRLVYAFNGHKSYKLRMFGSTDGESWQLMLEGAYQLEQN